MIARKFLIKRKEKFRKKNGRKAEEFIAEK